MLTNRQMKLISGMPKAENHIHVEGSIPWKLAIRLAKKNHVRIPAYTEEELKAWAFEMIMSDSLNGFMFCDRTINSVCLHEEDYEEVILELAKNARRQNIIYQEYHLDYPLNEERGIPIEVVMEGYRKGQKKAKELYGVEIVYIAGLDRTLSSEKCLEFVNKLEGYLDMIDGLGMDCEERSDPCIKHLESYKRAKEMGLFLTAHAGEDGPAQNIWDALLELKVHRIDHGCRAVEEPELMRYLADNQILCAMCPKGNVLGGSAKSYKEHPALKLMRSGVPVSFSSDDPPYVSELVNEYEVGFSEMGMTEDEIIQVARNGFAYSIKGKKYLPLFDRWIEEFRRIEG